MKHKTYKQRMLELETVKFILGHNYTPWEGNRWAIRHFSFHGIGLPHVEVSWFVGEDVPSISVGHTHYHGEGADNHALEQLKKALLIPSYFA
jgi:hypothetical protein